MSFRIISTTINASDTDMNAIDDYFLENGLNDASKLNRWVRYHQALVAGDFEKAARAGEGLFSDTFPREKDLASVVKFIDAIVEGHTAGPGYNDPVEEDKKRKRRKRRIR